MNGSKMYILNFISTSAWDLQFFFFLFLFGIFRYIYDHAFSCVFCSSSTCLLSGDTDGRVPVLATRYCINKLELPIKTSWRPWYHQKQVKKIAFKILLIDHCLRRVVFCSLIRLVSLMIIR